MMMDVIRDDLAALNVHSRRVFFRTISDRRQARRGRHDHRWLRKSGEVYRAGCHHPREASSRIGKIASRRCSAQRTSATTSTVHSRSRMAVTPTLPPTSPITDRKFDRGFLNLIDVWGADHGGYIKRMQAAVKAVSGGKAKLDVKLVQLVRLLRAGEPVKMSKRAGEFVTLREVVDEVGRDAVRFDMLYRKNDAALDFDLVKVIEHTRENPVFYVQYGHARGMSVFRNAREEMPDLPATATARRAYPGRHDWTA